MSSSPAARRPWRWLAVAGLVAALAAAGVVFLQRSRQPDMTRVFAANNRGAGYMEQFTYPEARDAFQEVVERAPRWLPGRINLGICLINVARGQNDPQEREASYQKAVELFQGVLAEEPDSPHAHFGLGLIAFEGRNDFAEAARRFRRVTEIDPQDPDAWCWLGRSLLDDSAEGLKCFERAALLDPYHNGALYGLQAKLREEGQDDKAAGIMKRWQELTGALWVTPFDPQYNTDLGRYALVIGRPAERPATPAAPLPLFQAPAGFHVDLRAGARWAGADDAGTDAAGLLLGAVRQRFGACLVVLDVDGDGRPDAFVGGGVVADGRLGNVLLRNDGEGRWTDITAEAGLAASPPVLGCTAADFDNDGRPDLLMTTAAGLKLWHNDGGKRFEDVTARAGLAAFPGVALGASFVDLDQDGDLDMVLAEVGTTAEAARAAFEGQGGARAGGLVVYLNVGEAKAANPQADPPPLQPAFRRLEQPESLVRRSGPAVGVVVSDVDLDHDLDLLVLPERGPPDLVLNDRLLTFTRVALPEALAGSGPWNGGLVVDVDNDERSDLLLVGPDKKPVLLWRQPSGPRDTGVETWFRPGAVDSPALKQATVADVDLDGRADVVGLSRDGKPVLLHNDGRGLAARAQAFGSPEGWPAGLTAVAMADVNGDGAPDLVAFVEGQGLLVRQSLGNGNQGLKLALSGHRRVDPAGGMQVRTNADGFGTRVIVQLGQALTSAEATTLSAGLGQSSQPLGIGLGRRAEAELLRLRWPDLCWQAEFNVPAAAGAGPQGVVRIEESNRKRTSCPVLFTWNGERFQFVTDFLGAGSLGEPLPGGGHRPPRAEESVKIEGSQLKPRDGRYVLKVAEPMDEITYLDGLKLVVLDHPPEVTVLPDERFSSGGPPPTQEVLAYRDRVFPVRAVDHRGRDVAAALKEFDRDTVNRFDRRTWIGFAEEHAVELDFGARLSGFGPGDRLTLVLAGWTDYPYPESIWAASQAGVRVEAPVLERRRPDGRWEKIADAGFPAGLPRVMTLDVTGQLTGTGCVLRLRTNMHVFWDQVYVARVLETVPDGQSRGLVRSQLLEVASADLAARPVMKEFSPDGREPTVYDYDRLDSFPVARQKGRLTRYGDVGPLLGGVDDRFVIFGPGDDLTVRFDARSLPPLSPGWTRSFVLRTWGYCKDCAPFTATGETVGPLPFRAMSRYPYGAGEAHPDPAYERQYNTRVVGPRER